MVFNQRTDRLMKVKSFGVAIHQEELRHQKFILSMRKKGDPGREKGSNEIRFKGLFPNGARQRIFNLKTAPARTVYMF